MNPSTGNPDPRDSVEYLRRAAEFAPMPTQIARGLWGWKTPAGLHLCAICAGKILARGASVPPKSTALWSDSPVEVGAKCVVCEVRIQQQDRTTE